MNPEQIVDQSAPPSSPALGVIRQRLLARRAELAEQDAELAERIHVGLPQKDALRARLSLGLLAYVNEETLRSLDALDKSERTP